MRWWRRRQLFGRMGIMLIGAGCLFFFLVLTDIEKCMVQLQAPYLLYTGEKPKKFRDGLFEAGLEIAAVLPAYAKNVHETPQRAGEGDEENLWASIDAQAGLDRDEETWKEEQKKQEEIRRMEEENERARRGVSDNDAPGADSENAGGSGDADKAADIGTDTVGNEDGEAQKEPIKRREKKAFEVDLDACRDFEGLVGTFYVIDSSTYIGADELNLNLLMGQDMSITRPDEERQRGGQEQDKRDEQEEQQAVWRYTDTEKPQILIYHTHSQEGYADSVPGDDTTTVMGAGEELARVLSEEYGFRVLHHLGKYDVKNRDYAYSEALPGIKKVLADNPTIEVVIDLHRDGVADSAHLVTELDGKKAAQVMLFNGLSRTKRVGEIEYLRNDYRQSNLAFSFQLQKHMMEYYPNLARKIYLKGYRYNMHFCPRSLLIELGAQTNTREEVKNSIAPLAHCIAMVLDGE